MIVQQKHTATIIFLVIALLVALFINISLGSVSIPLKEVLASLFGTNVSKDSWEFIILNYRIPKAITAIIAGSGLAIAGLLMQTLFRNPLAGPFVLGLSSGSSLGVALVILGAGMFAGLLGTVFSNPWTLVIASSLGSFLVLLAVLVVTFRIKDTMAILIIGLMFGSVTAAIVSVLSYFSNAEQLQQFVFWSFGSLGNQSWSGILVLTVCFFVGLLLSFASSKSLNGLLLGENYAQSMGLNIKRATIIIIIATISFIV